MTITAADLKLFASEYPLDTTYGGGRMSPYAIQTGVENNAFPDVPPAFRSSGGVQLRKVYAACVSANAEAVSTLQAILSAGPADAAVGVVAFAYGDQTTLRAAAATALAAFPYVLGTTYTYTDSGDLPATKKHFATFNPAPGALVGLAEAGAPGPPVIDVAVVTAAAAASGGFDVTFSKALPSSGYVLGALSPWPSAVKACGIATTTGTSGSNSVSVNRVQAQVVPNLAPYPTQVTGIEPDLETIRPIPLASSYFAQRGLSVSGGTVPIFRNGDTVVITGGGNTEAAVVSFVDYRGALTFSNTLAHSYPSGSVVSSAVQLGDVQAAAGPSFSQQTWTRVWSDAVVGNTIGAAYNRTAGVITTTNLGAITERWAVIYTSPTEFRAIGEAVGQVATGVKTTDFAPLNPATNTPFFTLPAAGWGSGWSTGHVLRLNTVGAYAPFWEARTVSPSAPGGLDNSTITMIGSVNA